MGKKTRKGDKGRRKKGGNRSGKWGEGKEEPLTFQL